MAVAKITGLMIDAVFHVHGLGPDGANGLGDGLDVMHPVVSLEIGQCHDSQISGTVPASAAIRRRSMRLTCCIQVGRSHCELHGCMAAGADVCTGKASGWKAT